ncbi:FAD synthetase [Penicillium expansum]|nr:FAD synthetase [Penicillium expansum]
MTEPTAKNAPFRPQDHLKPFPPLSPTTSEPLNPSTPPNQEAEPNQNGPAHANKQPPSDSTSDSTIPPLPTVISRIHARVQAFLDEPHAPDTLLASVQRQTRISLEVVRTALQRYKLSELSVSYNGGKDCLVLLILFLAGLHPSRARNDSHPATANANDTNPSSVRPRSRGPNSRCDVEDFVISSAEAYHLAITKYTTAPPDSTLRSSFEDYLARHPGIRAIFVGTRRTDPHGAQLTHFDRTDGGWPDFVRVHPVIDWHYAEIWAFIRHLDLKYCSLYDEGYTSLGGTSDTHPNPRLRTGAQADGQYLPAYQLTEDLEERLGRN